MSTLLFSRLGSILLAGFSAVCAGSQEPWRQYILAPSSRNPAPVAVYSIVGDAVVKGYAGHYVLDIAAGSRVSMDFGVEVGGHISFAVQTSSKSSQPLSLAFCESPSFVGPISDDTGAVYTMNWDQALNVTVEPDASGATFYQTPPERFRGGFRFVTFNALVDVTVSNITCEIGFAPNMPDLQGGTGYFYTSDAGADVLNRIWYAGAYTVQTNIAPADTGRYLPQVRPGWAYNASIGVASPSLMDGAKRDRANWPGDLGISGPTAMLALGAPGREALANSLATIFYYQNASTGEFPFAGPDTASFRGGSQSDTYHAWSLIAMHDYAMISGDGDWLSERWINITRGINFIVQRLDPQAGLQNQTQTNDWGRLGTGGFNSALNALDYHVLDIWSSLPSSTYAALDASPSAAQAAATSWKAAAVRLKQQYNALLWDQGAGLYRDNTTTTTLHPQDGNALALLYGLTETPAQASAISEGLTRNWNAIGPVIPELPDTISPFVSGIELLANLQGPAPNPARAVELLTRLWGYLIEGGASNNDIPLARLGGSTLVEGITANGSLYYRSADGYAYDAAYTSLSHGWSTAPTSALITGLLGLRLTGPGGATWVLQPQLLGLLSDVQAGFEAGAGFFEASASVSLSEGKAAAAAGAGAGAGGSGGVTTMTIQLAVPPGTEGTIVVPEGCERVVLGVTIGDQGKTTTFEGAKSISISYGTDGAVECVETF